MNRTIAFFWENYEFGGVSTYLAALINSKKFRNEKIIVFSNDTNQAIFKFKKLIKNKNVNIVTFRNHLDLQNSTKFIKMILICLRPVIFFFTLIKIFNLLKKFNIDLFISQCGGYGDFRSDLGSIIIAKLLNFKTKVIVFHHSYSKPKLWGFSSNLVNSVVMLFTDKFIFVSRATFKNLKKKIFFNPLKKANFKIINNGIELDRIKIRHKISRLINKNFLNGIVLSRISEDKGHEDLVEAIKILPEELKKKIRIYFVGEGKKKYNNYLKNKIIKEKLNKNFYFTGYINGSGRDIIKHFDFLISPSRYFEGFGLSIAEALSVGTLVISTKVGGVTTFLNQKNSILVQPFNVKQLSNSLKMLFFEQKKLIQKRFKGSMLIKTKFNNNKMGEEYFKFLK
jgi:glycosyltransferase involved in cell wall biosynthesis